MSKFEEACAWLDERAGKNLVIEIGADDPRADEYGPVEGSAIYAILHVTLGALIDGTDEDYDRPIKVLSIESLNDRSRLILDPARVREVKVDHPHLLRIVMGDTYVAFAGG
jgi:hypothetical protein